MKMLSKIKTKTYALKLLILLLLLTLVMLPLMQIFVFADTAYGALQNNYFSTSQIYEFSTQLNCDVSILYTKDHQYVRFLSKNNSIKIKLNSNFDLNFENAINEMVEYIFEVLNSINPNLTYEYSTDSTADITLEYMTTTESKNMSIAGRAVNSYQSSACTASQIYFNQNIVDDLASGNPNYAKHIVLHELCHTFGFNDIASDTNIESIMTEKSQDKCLTTLTQNDFGCLLLLYSNQTQTFDELKQNYELYCSSQYKI